MEYLREALKFLAAFLVICFFYKDSTRIFKAFFLHLERKLLIVHALKLIIMLVLVYKLNNYIPFSKTIQVFIFILVLLFLSLLTLKQVEFTIKGTRNSKYKTFKYGSKFAEYFLYLLAHLMNFWELKKHKKEIKEKSKEMMYVAIFPVQKYIMVSISHIEFTKRKEKFITDADLKEIKASLEPGDILLKRNDWQATNLGISGFWTHTGIFIGDLEKMDMYFSDVEELKGQKFSDRLKEINLEAYNNLLKTDQLSVIESIEEGVVIKPLSNIAKVDYFSAMRPRVSKEEKMKAIMKAYGFVGRPYDFFIDIDSSDAFLCTSLVSKSFENSIKFEVEEKLGKKVLLPNSIAHKFAKERRNNNRELDFVLFYDLDLNTRKAFKNSEIQFVRSSRRNVTYYLKRDMIGYLSTMLDLKFN
ncbi:MAG: YiiX/YebB-like N1pC/P60 family cysteine hydrolase [Bacillota bacterium]|nr:YiiX/YebB-like N1pC/P60 family cysteine hydrolase [Bacillota bacterium]